MDRRALLRRCGTAGLLAVAGCAGGDDSAPGEDLSVTDFRTREGEDGDLVVVVEVANTATENRTGTLYVDVTANGTTNTRVRSVEVGPARSSEVNATFDYTLTEFEDGGDLSFRWGHESE